MQDTPGAELLPGLRKELLHGVMRKGTREDVEMYSAFHDPFRLEVSGLAARLRAEGVDAVYVAGLAGEYCVRATALDAKEEGFEVVLVEEGTRCVDPEVWGRTRGELEGEGVKVASVESEEVARVRALGA